MPFYDEPNDRVIYVLAMPATGHLNSTLGFVNELLTKLDEMDVSRIVFYSTPQFFDRILRLPNNKKDQIEVRDYFLEQHFGNSNLLKLFMNFETTATDLFRMFRCFENSFRVASQNLIDYLIEDMRRDKPVLILYDQAIFFVKLALTLYEKKYQCQRPLSICYVTTFMFAKGIVPNWDELDLIGVRRSYKNMAITFYDLVRYFFVYYKLLYWNFGFSVKDILLKCEPPLGTDFLINNDLNLVFILKDIQPRVEKFDSNQILFVGSCVDESIQHYIRSLKLTNDDNKTLMDSINNFLSRPSKGIIYASLGTTFNIDNKDLYDVLIKACTHFADNYSIIISTANEQICEKYKTSKVIHPNILLLPFAPQMEILKIISSKNGIFVTHGGMNSVNEAIHFGVPVVVVPLSGDQPFVAHRMTDEMEMGVRISMDTPLTSKDLKQAMNEVLSNPRYKAKAHELSSLSQINPGHKKACEIIKTILTNEGVIVPSSRSNGLHKYMTKMKQTFSGGLRLRN